MFEKLAILSPHLLMGLLHTTNDTFALRQQNGPLRKKLLTKEQHVVNQGLLGEGLNACQLEGTNVWQVHSHAEVCLWRCWVLRHDSLNLPGLAIAAGVALTGAFSLRG